MFIVIEGVDGSGKATQTANLKKTLQKMGKTVATISFPSYKKHSSYFVREFLTGKYGSLDDVDPYIASTFYLLDRFDQAQHLQKLIDTHDYVISDRYTTSTLVHRGTDYLKNNQHDALTYFFDWVIDFEFSKAQLPMPDQIFFLAMSMNNITALIEKKKKEDRGYIDHGIDLAEQDILHQQYALEVGTSILADYFEGYHVVSCENSKGRLMEPDQITCLLLKQLGL